MFEDEEVLVQVGELGEDATELTYVILTNYDISMGGKTTDSTKRYWGQDGGTFTAKFITGEKSTFGTADEGTFTIFDVPIDNIARIKIGNGMMRDYTIEMNGDGTYDISRLKRAYGTAESVADLSDTSSDVLVISGVIFRSAVSISFEVDDDDGILLDSHIIFVLDNTYDFGESNWYAYGTKTTTWKITGFGYF